MENLLHLGLSNAVGTVVLALVAAAAAFVIRRRPALIHGLWLLVLLKLFTPPLVRLPSPWPAPEAPAEPVAAAPDAGASPERVLLVVRPPEAVDAVEVATAPPEPADLVANVAVPPVVEERPADAAAAPALAAAPGTDWAVVAALVWLAGSIGWFVLAGIRVVRFRRLLGFATPAPPGLRERAARLARKLGLARCPAVLLVPGRLSPMLWAAGAGPRLLVPSGLLGAVGDDQLDTLLLHELAHLRRRDHWVRGLEFFAMGVYWWNPVVWWARRELREAEEQCCDAWVVSVLSGSRRTYAEALVETLDFLSQAPAPAPLLASGIGHVSDLKRRLTMILTGTTPRALTWRGALAVLGLASLLPLLPTWVRAEPPEPEKQVIELRLDALRVEEAARVALAADAGQAEVQRLEAELKKKLDEVRDLQRRIRAAMEKGAGDNVPRALILKDDTGGFELFPGSANENWVRKFKGAGQEMRLVPEGATGEKGVIVFRLDTQDGAKPAAPAKGTLYELVPGEKGTLILRPVVQPPGAAGPVRFRVEDAVKVVNATPGAPPAAYTVIRRTETDARTKELEKRLDAIMLELEQLRKEMKARPNSQSTPRRNPEPKPETRPQEEAAARNLDAARRTLETELKVLRKAAEDQKPREDPQPKP
jgi:beta-lactamase regulating signal transducer with metallopeptidase domain